MGHFAPVAASGRIAPSLACAAIAGSLALASVGRLVDASLVLPIGRVLIGLAGNAIAVLEDHTSIGWCRQHKQRHADRAGEKPLVHVVSLQVCRSRGPRRAGFRRGRLARVRATPGAHSRSGRGQYGAHVGEN